MTDIRNTDNIIEVNADLYRIAAMMQSTEEARYYLNGVYIHPRRDGKGVTLVATDGHRMIVVHDESGRCDKAEIVSLNASKAALAACKHKITLSRPAHPENNPAPRLTVAGGVATVTSGGATVTCPNAIVDGTFPDWSRVVPDIDKAMAAGLSDAFEPKYLAAFATVAIDLAKSGSDGRTLIMRVQSAAPGSPALVDFGSHYAFGVLMPKRYNDAPKDDYRFKNIADMYDAPAG